MLGVRVGRSCWAIARFLRFLKPGLGILQALAHQRSFGAFSHFEDAFTLGDRPAID